MIDLKELSLRKDKLSSGHFLCPGCGAAIIARQVLLACDKNLVVSCATGCLEVSTTKYPFSAWKVPYIHNAFENVAATISGIESAYKILKKKNKIKKEIKFLAFAGDGGSYDIGLQALSGALERGHDFVYVCYDNEAYANTGYQRSSATPIYADTTTDPIGKIRKGKQEYRKDLTKIIAMHNIPYVAQTSPAFYQDLITKVRKAFTIKGPTFLNIISPCVLGWNYNPNLSIKLAKLAVETCFWPLYEIENGDYKLNYKPSNKLPIIEFIKTQGRFKHLLLEENKQLLKKIQENVDFEWVRLLKLCNQKV